MSAAPEELVTRERPTMRPHLLHADGRVRHYFQRRAGAWVCVYCDPTR